MKTPQTVLLFFTRRAPRGQRARLVCEPAALVRVWGEFCTVLTSRPIYAGARRRQYVPTASFLNLSRLGMGSPAAPQTVANAAA